MNNRQLKFRAWDDTKLNWIDVKECSYNDLFEDEKYIVQQFTGLKDKNEKEIYEGDIIKYHRVFENKREVIELTSCIKFENGAFGFDMKGFNDMFMSLEDDSDIEVIGNIFENNELLEK